MAVDHITFITEDDKGRIWIGTLEGGLNVYDPATQKVSYYGSGTKSKEKWKTIFGRLIKQGIIHFG